MSYQMSKNMYLEIYRKLMVYSAYSIAMNSIWSVFSQICTTLKTNSANLIILFSAKSPVLGIGITQIVGIKRIFIDFVAENIRKLKLIVS